jgi:subtilisin family serine protease
LVARTGNNGTSSTKYYPAAYDSVIAVANIDKNDQKYYWSNGGDWVDVAAPGVDIYSTLPSEWVEVLDASGVKRWVLRPRYGYMSSTSMATPYVSGLAGLILSKNAGLTNKEVRYRIERTAVDVWAWSLSLGYNTQ